MHYPKPFYRSQRNGYVVQLGKSQKLLAKGPQSPEVEAEAYKVYHRLMASEGLATPTQDHIVQHAVDIFLDDVRQRVELVTFEFYKKKLQGLVMRYGRMKVSDLKPHHVLSWVKTRKWTKATMRGTVVAIKVCFAWLAKSGNIASNPLSDIKPPRANRRERTLTPDERERIASIANPQLLDYLNALSWTGCRPGEIMRLEAKHIDFEAGWAALPGKTTNATGLLIEFPLIPEMYQMCERLAQLHPIGPIFRSTIGGTWNQSSVRQALRRVTVKLGIVGVTAYTYRHSFATDALQRGIPLTDVAALMNHRSIQTTMNYNHIKDRRGHLKEQAQKAQKDPQA
ncbi:tyrosine-type recombinase/integrase [Singulisphaera sp. PoT]|uniref:tyrosine-type recombinase/integrase n=1 Tax=Singulisphaera sp. PoT TaxID=3411797 RepID=UPI003BF53E69